MLLWKAELVYTVHSSEYTLFIILLTKSSSENQFFYNGIFNLNVFFPNSTTYAIFNNQIFP